MSEGENTGGRPSLAYLQGSDDPAPRTIGNYRIIARFIGAGMSDVYLGHKRSTFGFVRLAVVKHAPRTAPDFEMKRQMLFDEARAVAYLDHPNLVVILDADEDESGAYICLEYVDGTDMRVVNSKLRTRGEALPFELACFIAAEVLRGLHHAHTAEKPDGSALKIVHRDVNPSNILISRTGHVKLTDFGVVHMKDRVQDPTQPGLVKGKFAYLAPEYIKGQPVDARVDIYSVGVVLFELLTGRPLIKGASAYEIMRKIVNRELRLERLEREGVPESLREIVERAVAGNPGHRFATGEDMANALETWVIKSGLHVSPWILSAFFRQHALFEESAKTSIPVPPIPSLSSPSAAAPAPPSNPAPRASAPSAPGLSTTPGTRPFVGELGFDSEQTVREAPIAKPAALPNIGPPEQLPATMPATQIPAAQTLRTGPPSFTPSQTPREGRAFPSFSEPPGLRGPESIPTTPGTESPLAQRATRPASRPPPVPPSNPPPNVGFESGETTEPATQSPIANASTPPVFNSAHPAYAPPPEYPGSSSTRIDGHETSGTFSSAAPPVVLSRLVSSKATGTLELKAGLIWKRVDLSEGRVVWISSNMGMEDIAELLLRNRLIKRGELDRAMRESHGSQHGVLERLIDLKAISADELGRQLGQNVERVLEDVLSWEEGAFEFHPGAVELPPVLPNIDLNRMLNRRMSSPPVRRSEPPPPPAPPRSNSNPGISIDSLPPRKRPSLAEALGISKQVTDGSGRGRKDSIEGD